MEQDYSTKCGKCGERAVALATVSYFVQVESDGRKHDVAIPDLVTPQCGKCGNIVLHEEANCRITAEIRKVAGLTEEKKQARRVVWLGLAMTAWGAALFAVYLWWGTEPRGPLTTLIIVALIMLSIIGPGGLYFFVFGLPQLRFLAQFGLGIIIGNSALAILWLTDPPQDALAGLITVALLVLSSIGVFGLLLFVAGLRYLREMAQMEEERGKTNT